LAERRRDRTSGCLNLHPSLLPNCAADPIFRALERGLTTTGLTFTRWLRKSTPADLHQEPATSGRPVRFGSTADIAEGPICSPAGCPAKSRRNRPLPAPLRRLHHVSDAAGSRQFVAARRPHQSERMRQALAAIE